MTPELTSLVIVAAINVVVALVTGGLAVLGAINTYLINICHAEVAKVAEEMRRVSHALGVKEGREMERAETKAKEGR